jgi:hypothetical protein
MIPLFAVVHVAHPKGEIRIWAPLFILWLLVLPFALVLWPLVFAALALAGLNPIRVSGAGLAVLCALPGVHIQVESPAARVLVRIQ